jgi:copper homeostasis protein
MTRFELEVCVDRVGDALKAAAAGATRIEMNCALELDGLTPPPASCQWLKQNCDVPIVAMLRPHHRSFTYSTSEELGILRDCQLLLEAGVDGIVFGSLDDSGRIAIPLLQKVMALCSGRQLIFHRAFDCLKEPLIALEQLMECGVHRVLTSGGAPTAEAGIEQLTKLVEISAAQIEILPGAGVSSRNARRILTETGCSQLHGSLRIAASSLGPSTEEIQKVLEIGVETLRLRAAE